MSLDSLIRQMDNPQEFTRLCNAVLCASHPRDFQVIDGTRADQGNDGYLASEKRMFAFFCPMKPERQGDTDYVRKLKSDMAKAAALRDEGAYEIEKWTFVTPGKLSNQVVAIMREEAKNLNLEASHIESTYLAGALLKHKHLIDDFPQLMYFDIGERIEEIHAAVTAAPTQKSWSEEDREAGYKTDPVPSNDPDISRVLELRSCEDKKKAKAELRAIYSISRSPAVRVNAVASLADLFDPREDDIEEVVMLCDDGARIACDIEEHSLQAWLKAMKGSILSLAFSLKNARTALNIRIENETGDQLLSREQRYVSIQQILSLEKRFLNAFDEAIQVCTEYPDLRCTASVLTIIGTAAGSRSVHLRDLGAHERATGDMIICRRALLAAKDAYERLEDDKGVAIVLHNLANQIRFAGHIDEALLLLEEVITIASRLNEPSILQKAEYVRARIRDRGNLDNPSA